MLRAWLLLLKRSALAGRRVAPGTTFGIVTGEPLHPIPSLAPSPLAYPVPSLPDKLSHQQPTAACAVPPRCHRPAGWGKHSKDNVATIKPMVARMLAEELGPRALPVYEPLANPGLLAVDDDE